MNYFGFVLDGDASESDVYAFLRTALMQSAGDLIPVRGPRAFNEGDRRYCLAIDGDLANFTGNEEVMFAGKVVYRCRIHGGLIK